MARKNKEDTTEKRGEYKRTGIHYLGDIVRHRKPDKDTLEWMNLVMNFAKRLVKALEIIEGQRREIDILKEILRGRK